MPTPEQVAWLAGVFESAGTFSASRQRRGSTTGKERIILRFSISSTDELLVQKAAQVFPGYGSIRSQTIDGRQTRWIWTVGRMPEIIEINSELWPWLSERRCMQIVSAFGKYENNCTERGVPFYNMFRGAASAEAQ